MENRAVRHRGGRHRARTRQRIGWALLTSLLAVALVGTLWGTPQPAPAASPPPAAPTEPPHTEAADADEAWYLTLVNKWNPIPEDYAVDLVEVAGGEQVDKRIYEPLMQMLEAAKEDNLDQLPLVVSGYRTQEKQQSLYHDKIAKYLGQGCSESEAKELAEKWVALPGHSEHQLGFAVDLNGAVYDVYLWLQANSYKYGFIFRYPGSKTEITGTAEEVWHYRYVGVEAATEMYEQGVCLEEYLAMLDGRK